jgi:UDP-glucose 4-epimerase
VRVTGVDCFTDYYDAALKRRNLATASQHPAFRLIELDLAAADLSALPDVNVVFHQAAQPGVRASWGAEFAVYTHHNVLATQRLLERYRGTKLERFVYASSSSVYGDAERYPTDETLLPRPFSPYGVTKLAGEHLVLLYGRNFGVPVSALRYFTVYGRASGRTWRSIASAVRCCAASPIVGATATGTQVAPTARSIADAIEANVARVDAQRAAGVYNVGGGSQVEVRGGDRILLDGVPSALPQQVRLEPRRPATRCAPRADAERSAHDLEFTVRRRSSRGLAVPRPELAARAATRRGAMSEVGMLRLVIPSVRRGGEPARAAPRAGGGARVAGPHRGGRLRRRRLARRHARGARRARRRRSARARRVVPAQLRQVGGARGRVQARAWRARRDRWTPTCRTIPPSWRGWPRRSTKATTWCRAGSRTARIRRARRCPRAVQRGDLARRGHQAARLQLRAQALPPRGVAIARRVRRAAPLLPALAHWAGFRVGEIAVHHRARRYGTSKFGPARFVNGFLDLMSAAFISTSALKPLHVFGRVGLLFFLVGTGIGLWFIGLWAAGEPIRVRPLMLFGAGWCCSRSSSC